MARKQDSNSTGLRYAEEESIKTLPALPVWYPLEPNGYNDFGGQLTTIARNPINPSRQRKKGVTTDLDASGGFGQDFTQTGLTRLLQGFFFADLREKAATKPMNGAAQAITGVTALDDVYAAAAGLDAFAAGDLVFASGFGQSANNGLKLVATSAADALGVSEALVDEAPGADAKLQHVGFQFAAGEAEIDATGSYPRLARASGAKDFTSFGLIEGEWVYIGGDLAAEKFASVANNGFARVRATAADYIEFDKTSATMVTDDGAAKTIRLFFGNVLKNESGTTIKRRTYNIERTLGQDDDGVMSEYLVGAVANEMSLQVRQADKVTVDLSFVATDNEQRAGTIGVKAGDRPALAESPAFNTSSDFSRIKMHVIQDGVTDPDPLFAFLTELTLTVTNNVEPLKAVAVLGAFDVSAGTFAVSGNVTAYFADIAAVQAVRNNADVALDFALVKNNAGIVFDIPLIALGEGRLNVEQDQPITLPLSMEAAEGSAGHTLLLNEFPYLPNAADV